ncbi:hypothetical protein NUACC21_48240 [Scytonema sp. NUACC21]
MIQILQPQKRLNRICKLSLMIDVKKEKFTKIIADKIVPINLFIGINYTWKKYPEIAYLGKLRMLVE